MIRFYFTRVFIFFILIVLSNSYIENEADHLTISATSKDVSEAKTQRYFLYEVNFGEGFNLRRDVYMRIAQVVQTLRTKGENYILVLPPWGNLYHWRDRAQRIPWSELFDIKSLNLFVPVIEFEDFLKQGNRVIDQVVYLQHYAEGWSNGKWEEKFDVRECIEVKNYYSQDGDKWKGFFYSYTNVRAKNFTCLSIQGEGKTLAQAITQMFSEAKTIFIDRAETILHDSFGNAVYWRARRSMRYAADLRNIANQYREKYLDSKFEEDKIELPENWVDELNRERTAIGGKYIAAHLRRQDFVRSHDNDVPSLEEAAIQLSKICKKLSLSKVFIATDADQDEIYKLKVLLEKEKIELFYFQKIDELSDGAESIIDQIIASKARYFIGTRGSTFSYRIREDREIMHFPVDSTFNDLCKYAKDVGDNEKCEQPAKWKIVY